MDVVLLRTFLEVSASGSFVAAAERLLVTQSAVSLRIQRLEDQLGRPLFTRSKAGAVLTGAGKEFEHYALSMVKLWEEARQHVAIPEGFDRTLSIGAQYSLWPRLGFRFIDRLQELAPGLSVRAESGFPDRLARYLVEGQIQFALTYSPHLRPGLSCRQVLQEELVMVASWPNPSLPLEGRYIFVDWGPEFVRAHSMGLPGLAGSGVTMALGSQVIDYIRRRKAAAYLPARAVEGPIRAGELHLVPDAPRFPFPIWALWSDELDPIILAAADAALAHSVEQIDELQDNVLINLDKISENGGSEILGESLRSSDT